MKLQRPLLCNVRHRWKRHPKIVWLECCARPGCPAQRHTPGFRWGRPV